MPSALVINQVDFTTRYIPGDWSYHNHTLMVQLGFRMFNHTTRSANTITIVLYFLYYELALHLASINVYEAAINYMMDGKK